MLFRRFANSKRGQALSCPPASVSHNLKTLSNGRQSRFDRLHSLHYTRHSRDYTRNFRDNARKSCNYIGKSHDYTGNSDDNTRGSDDNIGNSDDYTRGSGHNTRNFHNYMRNSHNYTRNCHDYTRNSGDYTRNFAQPSNSNEPAGSRKGLRGPFFTIRRNDQVKILGASPEALQPIVAGGR